MPIIKNLEERIKEYIIPTSFMLTAGFADSLQTYRGVVKFGERYLGDIEGNHLINALIHETNLETGLYLPKIVGSALALGLSMGIKKMSQSRAGNQPKKLLLQGDGKYLLYLAGMWWTFGFAANLYLYYWYQ